MKTTIAKIFQALRLLQQHCDRNSFTVIFPQPEPGGTISMHSVFEAAKAAADSGNPMRITVGVNESLKNAQAMRVYLEEFLGSLEVDIVLPTEFPAKTVERLSGFSQRIKRKTVKRKRHPHK